MISSKVNLERLSQKVPSPAERARGDYGIGSKLLLAVEQRKPLKAGMNLRRRH